MANETLALVGRVPANNVAEDDYQSFCEALGASARGRAFLAEYAKRNRHADTQVVLAALDRFEQAAHIQNAAREAERIRQDLRALLDTLRNARPQIDNSPSAIKAATLAALIDFAEARIEALVTSERAAQAQNYLSQVPELDQPELPIPQPLSGAPMAIALVQTGTRAAPRISNSIPEIDFVTDAAPQVPHVSQVTQVPPPPVSELLPSETGFIEVPVARTAIPPLAIEFVEPALVETPAAALPETYEVWIEPETGIRIDAAADTPLVFETSFIETEFVETNTAETAAEAGYRFEPETVAAAAPDEPAASAPPLAIIPPEMAAKIAGLSPRQAAIALLAAQSETQGGPQQPATVTPAPAAMPAVAEPAAHAAAPALLSPRQAAIAALAAQQEAEAKGEPVKGETQAPPPTAVSQPAQAIVDPIAAIMELSEEERLALFT